MNIPRNHHYLPRFYLDRWAVNGRLFRYVRPRGLVGPVHALWRPPTAVAYERDLYRLTDIDDPIESQQLELEFFQQIDDRAATALQMVDAGLLTAPEDRIALSQFMVSLLHRSPSRLAAIRQDLASQARGLPFERLEGDAFNDALKATANRLLMALVGSTFALSVVSRFKPYRIEIVGTSKTLLTSDRPITLSAMLVSSDAFMILPYAPDRLLILAHDPEIARAFATQKPSALVAGINQAVVEQSREIVVAADTDAYRMVQRLFLQPTDGRVFDTLGLIRRKSPYRDLRPRTRSFSRHRKAAIRYLGQTE